MTCLSGLAAWGLVGLAVLGAAAVIVLGMIAWDTRTFWRG